MPGYELKVKSYVVSFGDKINVSCDHLLSVTADPNPAGIRPSGSGRVSVPHQPLQRRFLAAGEVGTDEGHSYRFFLFF